MGFMNTTQIKLGDTISANYGDAMVVVGKAIAFDGGIQIKLDTPVEIYGTMRDSVYITKHWRHSVKLVQASTSHDSMFVEGGIAFLR